MQVIQIYGYFRHLKILVFVALLLFSSTSNEVLAKKEKIINYRIRIDLLNPSKIYFGEKEQQIVILEKVGQQIWCYQFGDPEKSIIKFDASKCKIVHEKYNFIEGFLLKDSKDSVSILRTNEISDSMMEKYHIMAVHNEFGIMLTIPISEIRKLEIWRDKGRPGKGAIIGASVGLALTAMATAAFDPDEDGGLIEEKGEVFVIMCVITVLPGAAFGALIGSEKRKVRHFVINGNCDKYFKIRGKLNKYFVEPPENKPEELSMKYNYLL